MIERVLVANRGEIARRVFRTCRELGVGTVAVFSDADVRSPHVAEAELAVRLLGSAPADTYLRGELIVEAARRSGADAVHPGYGFLSESAEFARAVAGAGLTWIGPPPDAIEAMGSKVAAKKLMAGAGVPVLEELDPELVTDEDLPVLVKASAGGGGRGMRVVRAREELPAALSAARAEAGSAFGDGTVFCEPYLEHCRHVEVQVLADAHGTVWALGERECSIQRRYQKVIEEAPSPTLDHATRQRLADAAVTAARAIGYAGAGTVEFLVAPDGRFFFLEMNTRLQVEHPVTECVRGLDLVALQLHVAADGWLTGEPPPASGHAIEARLYAEDPAAGWRPQSGVLHRFAVPGVDCEFAAPARPHGLRLDSGVADGDTVGVHYDPMLAKVIAWAPTRGHAARRLAAALAGARIHGLVTNRDLLVRVLRHPAFLAGDTDTAFFDEHDLAELAAPLADRRAEELSALAAALADAEHNRAKARVQDGLPSGWRNVPSQPQHKAYAGSAGVHDVAYRFTRDGAGIEGRPDIALVSASPEEVVLDVDDVRHALTVARYEGLVCVDSALGAVNLTPIDRFPDPAAAPAAGSLLAPMPGLVTAVYVADGDPVEAGQPMMALEAMKMQHTIAAPAAGTVMSVRVAVGAQVDAGSVLAILASESSDRSEASEEGAR